MTSDGAGGCGRSPGTPRWRRQLDACVPALSIKQFNLHSAPERFDHRVAEAITDRAHRREQSGIDRATRERPRGELSLGEAFEGAIDPWTIRSTDVTSAVSVRGRISPLSAVEHRGTAGGIDPGVCNVGCRLTRLPVSSHGVLAVDPTSRRSGPDLVHFGGNDDPRAVERTAAALGVELRVLPELNHLDAFAAVRGGGNTSRPSQGGRGPP